ncbi:hypothetical protein [Haloarchaeobius litoreus]|uniref:Uncharacterized protein n=1 Tax=Haloarchaeobius litoreus TaxID=755306 RepID=A0ABD6DNN1_9EURY|nr:hypothetical protein [Haloarchaeobius litoreus]
MSGQSLLGRLPESPIDSVSRSVPRSVRMVGFWSAVSLPVVNLALLVWGLDSPLKTAAFLVLLAWNALALVVGKRYDP